MISVTHFASADADFGERSGDALAALAARPGFVRGRLGRDIDDPQAWVLVTEWADVGSYRRALGNVDVRIRAATLLAEARALPSSFETLAAVDADGTVRHTTSDREPGA